MENGSVCTAKHNMLNRKPTEPSSSTIKDKKCTILTKMQQLTYKNTHYILSMVKNIGLDVAAALIHYETER